VDRFNRQDWDGIRELIGVDARLQVADRFAGAFAKAAYFTNYHRWPKPWRLIVDYVHCPWTLASATSVIPGEDCE
jgi:hypothetical protein